MSVGSQKFIISHVMMILLSISFRSDGCTTSSNHSPVLVRSLERDVHLDNKSSNNMLITFPSKISVTSIRKTSAIHQPVQVNQMIQQKQIRLIEQPIRIQNGHIVYNRHYTEIPKGSYTDDIYTVKHGDTLFYIAWITGNNFFDLAQRNNIHAPYNLVIGQKLYVSDNITEKSLMLKDTTTPTANTSTQKNKMTISAQKSTEFGLPKSIIIHSANENKKNNKTLLDTKNGVETIVTTPAVNPISNSISLTNNNRTLIDSPISTWIWPAKGRIIEKFSSFEGGNKGIDIEGNRGQDIVATADGRVVYAGDALRGYGNLIIIKHNNDYLSAYAHNNTMFVREQQEVKVGQKIATMGSTGTSSTRLHFEIRYKGKSVNPLQYLPQR